MSFFLIKWHEKMKIFRVFSNPQLNHVNRQICFTVAKIMVTLKKIHMNMQYIVSCTESFETSWSRNWLHLSRSIQFYFRFQCVRVALSLVYCKVQLSTIACLFLIRILIFVLYMSFIDLQLLINPVGIFGILCCIQYKERRFIHSYIMTDGPTTNVIIQIVSLIDGSQ